MTKKEKQVIEWLVSLGIPPGDVHDTYDNITQEEIDDVYKNVALALILKEEEGYFRYLQIPKETIAAARKAAEEEDHSKFRIVPVFWIRKDGGDLLQLFVSTPQEMRFPKSKFKYGFRIGYCVVDNSGKVPFGLNVWHETPEDAVSELEAHVASKQQHTESVINNAVPAIQIA